MKDFAQSLQLPPKWWWGSVAAVVVVALIFLAIGAHVAALVCIVCAAGIAALAVSAGATTQASSDRQSSRHAEPSDSAAHTSDE